MITPEQLSDILVDDGNTYIYIATTDYYSEIFDMLTQKLKIPPKKIAHLPAPHISRELWKLAYKHRFGGQPEPINTGALGAAILLPDRTDALKCLPKNGVVAEVGVAYGDFSRKLIDHLSPKKFYAIDYFHQSDPFVSYWERDDFARDSMPHQQWYENRFKTEIKSGMMETRQGLSWDCLAQFPDNYFDYVYLDADHYYQSVKRDIEVLNNKVKTGGFIQFNDYCISPACKPPYGVINAVNSFVNTGQHKIKYYCINSEPLLIGSPDVVIQIQKPHVLH